MACQFFQKEGFSVYYLEGDWYEMGLFFGEVLKERFRGSPLEYYLNNAPRVLEHSLQGYPRALGILSRWALKYLLFLPVAMGTSREDRAFLKGMARGAGLSFLDLWLTYSSPDALNCLVSLLTRMSRTAIPHVPVACSSFIAWGDATRDGSLLHGRNLDFSGGVRWSHRHGVMVLRPRNGIPSVTVMGDGAYIPGVTSTNAHGLTIGLHMNFTRDVNLVGRNVLTLASQALSRARGVEEAVEIITRGRRVSGWTFILSHAPSRSAALLELSGNQWEKIKPEKDWMVYTNCYLSNKMKEGEYAPSYTWVENDYSRYLSLRALVERHAGGLDPALSLAILGNRHDITCDRDLALGNGVAAVANVSSALFHPQGDRVWLALGTAPPNTYGRYVALSLEDLLSGKDPAIKEEAPGDPMPSSLRASLDHYMEALRLWDEELDLEGALGALDRALEALEEEGQEPLYYMVRGLLLAKKGEYGAARDDFVRVVDSFLSPYRKAQARLWLARLADLEGKREEAVEGYREVISLSSWLDITRDAWMGIRRPYNRRLLNRMDVAFLVAEYIDY